MFQGQSAYSINPRLVACLPFIKYLISACKSLPAEYIYTGKVRRGVKYVYPSLDHHDPEAHFQMGKMLMWFEFKSTSKRQEVMTRPLSRCRGGSSHALRY